MTRLVDTSVWSLPFRRDGEQQAPQAIALRSALEGGAAANHSKLEAWEPAIAPQKP